MSLFKCKRKPLPPKPKPPVPKPVPTPGPPVPVPAPTPPGPAPPPSPSPTTSVLIQVVNRSSVISDADARPVVPALNTQITRDYLPAWDPNKTLGVRVEFVGTNQSPAVDAWQVLLLNNSDQAGALGYHDVTPNGQPLGKIFVETDFTYGESWTVTTSHEALEMLGDPNINLEVVRKANGWTYVYENCDAVEHNTYKIDGVEVSDFVTPAWFKAAGNAPFDFLNVVREPFSLAPGGYISVDKGDGQGWTQIYGQRGAASHGYEARPKVGSRRERRTVPRSDWLRSAT